jgi:hypothetical protein
MILADLLLRQPILQKRCNILFLEVFIKKQGIFTNRGLYKGLSAKTFNSERGGLKTMAQVELNTAAPDFALADFNGNLVRLSDYKGINNVMLVLNRGFA